MGQHAIAAPDQAKSDNSRGRGWILRQSGGILRATGQILSLSCRILRFGDRILRESLAESDSVLPICSFYVLFVFLHLSFVLTLDSDRRIMRKEFVRG